MTRRIFINSLNAPLYDALLKYSDINPVPFHMPGHKMGRGIPEDFLKNVARIDVTEIPGTDNLHWPEGVIDEAQKLASRVFGADRTFFLVNGSTCGIQSMILSICRPGDKLVVGRDCHKSVINGMILGDIHPIYIKPGFNRNFGIPEVISPSDVEHALRENPDAKGVLITRPNYFGVCSDIGHIAEITHSHGKILAVDEAHGAHLRFNSRLPVSALEAGADICVQSAHKTLPAFTQGAYLHVKSGKLDIDRLRFYLSALQTSSPSYVIMASLDISREIMEECGQRYLDAMLDNIQWFENKAGADKNLRVLKSSDISSGDKDKTRIVINSRYMGITGYELEKTLREEYNIQVEMSNFYNVICIATIADRKESFGKLYNALSQLSKKHNTKNPLDDIYIKDFEIPRQGVELRDILKFEGCTVKLNNAAGRISRNIITPYPPGTPLICPGEVITQDAIDYIRSIIALGGSVVGIGRNLEVDVIK